MTLSLVPMNLAEANAFVKKWHRHHKPVPGEKFSLGVADELGVLHGVAIVGRPVARMLDNGLTLEVNRTCTDGTKNANSMLYAAAWKAAKALGYRRLITYTLPSESGASLRGANWRLVGTAGGGKWSRPSRYRLDDHPLVQKLLWEASEANQSYENQRSPPAPFEAETVDIHAPLKTISPSTTEAE